MKHIALIMVVFNVVILFALSAKYKSEKGVFYDISQDQYLLDLERRFRENPKEGLSCNSNVCESSLISERDNYLKANCLTFSGKWHFSEKKSSFHVITDRKYYKLEDCNK